MFKVREIRQSRGLTQVGCAQCLGITRSGYGLIENGNRGLNLDDAIKLADLFGCTLDELAGRVWPPKSGAPITKLANGELSDDEAELLASYRRTDDRGRDNIRAIASAQPGDGSLQTKVKVG